MAVSFLLNTRIRNRKIAEDGISLRGKRRTVAVKLRTHGEHIRQSAVAGFRVGGVILREAVVDDLLIAAGALQIVHIGIRAVDVVGRALRRHL